MDSDIWYVVVVMLVCLAIFCAFAIGVTYLGKPACEAQTIGIRLPHRWSFWGGCQVQETGQWIPLGNWRYIGN